MNKKLDEALQRQINRLKAIDTYHDTLKEGVYQFHQELPEAEEEAPEQPPVDPGTPNPGEMAPSAQGGEQPTDGAMPPPAGDPNDPQGGMTPDAGVAPEGGDMNGGMDDAPADPGMEDGGDTEVDVTDLVNNSNQVNANVMTMMSKIDQTAQKFDAMFNQVSSLEGTVGKMDSIIMQMQALTKQVELMRPPTETERRKAVASDSYPYNISLEDYEKGEGAKNQTELEKNPNSKMSMMKTIMSDYNDSTVKDSFNPKQQDDPFKNY